MTEIGAAKTQKIYRIYKLFEFLSFVFWVLFFLAYQFRFSINQYLCHLKKIHHLSLKQKL